jgi:hypothetical protein
MLAGDAFVEALAQRVSELVLAQMPKQPLQTEPRQWFGVKAAAAYCGVSEWALRAAIKSDQLPRHQRGERSIALRREDLDRWMGQGR